MHKFYEDKEAAARAEEYIGKSMGEIMESEKNVFEKNRSQIDAAHDGFVSDRTKMLTVQKLIDYLKTQDPNACILAYEQNSDAYIEQLPDLPSHDILTVAEAKKIMREDLQSWYKDVSDAQVKIENDLSTIFRYSEDNDIIIRFS